MLKFTVYRKVNLSRNFFVILLVICILLVVGKIAAAEQKISTYEKAMKLYKSGEMLAAEKEFRIARLNPAVNDHNKEMDEILTVLTPIRTEMEDLDQKAYSQKKPNDVKKLAKTYDRWKAAEKGWLAGTPVEKDMYGEMLEKTMLDKDMYKYFSATKQVLMLKLSGQKISETADEESVHTDLTLIPAEYYGGDQAKPNEIRSAFLQYYTKKMTDLMAKGEISSLVSEGKRQFAVLHTFSYDTAWLSKSLNEFLLKVLKESYDQKEYGDFATQASIVKRLENELGEAQVFNYIDSSRNELMNKASRMVRARNYQEAITIYEQLSHLEDTSSLVTETNLAWDKYEPIRVLKRDYSSEDFTQYITAYNKWGAESAVAAVSSSGKLYYGTLNGTEAMAVKIADISDDVDASNLTSISFRGDLSDEGVPVLLLDVSSDTRKHRYVAYNVTSDGMNRIFDIDCDGIVLESTGVLLVDNPTGDGAGEQAYYEKDYDGNYVFSRIKVDYIDINVEDITSYKGKKIRFGTYIRSTSDQGALALISETYNYSTYEYDQKYMLLTGNFDYNYSYTTIIGVFTGYTTVTMDGEQVTVPVVQVKRVE